VKRPSQHDADLRRYDGFRVRWDKDLGAYVFESHEERDRWQISVYGAVRDAFRREDEPTDKRPLLYYNNPPVDLAWLRAVRAAPREHYPNLPLSEYLAEVGKLATGLGPSVKPRITDEGNP